jgi:transposase
MFFSFFDWIKQKLKISRRKETSIFCDLHLNYHKKVRSASISLLLLNNFLSKGCFTQSNLATLFHAHLSSGIFYPSVYKLIVRGLNLINALQLLGNHAHVRGQF